MIVSPSPTFKTTVIHLNTAWLDNTGTSAATVSHTLYIICVLYKISTFTIREPEEHWEQRTSSGQSDKRADWPFNEPYHLKLLLWLYTCQAFLFNTAQKEFTITVKFTVNFETVDLTELNKSRPLISSWQPLNLLAESHYKIIFSVASYWKLILILYDTF